MASVPLRVLLADDHAIVQNRVAQIYPRACWHSGTAAHRFVPDPHPASP